MIFLGMMCFAHVDFGSSLTSASYSCNRSTYATTVRDSKRARERDFLKKVHL